jgi:hypothetical protein
METDPFLLDTLVELEVKKFPKFCARTWILEQNSSFFDTILSYQQLGPVAQWQSECLIHI